MNTTAKKVCLILVRRVSRQWGNSLILGTWLLTAACAKTTEPAVPTISYRGSVELVDEFGQPVTDRSGVTVSVVDRPGVAATTDGAGSFSLQVPQGSQRLSLTKVGYGTYLTPALTVADAPLVASQPITLGQITSTYVTFIRGWEPMNYGEYFRFTGRINLGRVDN